MDRLERVADLLAYLLDRPRPATLVEILGEVPGYPDSFESARVQFERDKKLLRDELGVNVTMEGDAYVVRPEDYYLPDLGLTPEETVALNLALSSVRLEGAPAEEAAWKLGGFDAAGAPLLEVPVLPALPLIRQAMRDRACIRFVYGGTPRCVRPYGLLCREAFWYVQGPEDGTAGVKNFRVDRIEGAVEMGEAGAFEPPADFDPRAALPTEPFALGHDEPVEARVRLDAVVAQREVARLGEARVVEQLDGGGVFVAIDVVSRAGFRSWLFGLRHHAQVVAPRDLVDDVVAWLRTIVEGAA